MAFVSVRYCSFVFDGRSRRTHYRTHHIRCPRSPIFSCGTNDRWHSFVLATDRWHSSMFVQRAEGSNKYDVQSLCFIMKRIYGNVRLWSLLLICVQWCICASSNENTVRCPIMSKFRLKGERQITRFAQARSCSPPMAGIR